MKHKRIRTYDVLKYAVIILLSVCALFPFYSMIVMGTYKTRDLYIGIKVWFGNYFLKNLATLASAKIWRNYLNSLIVSMATMFCTVLVSTLAGVGYAKYNFRGKQLFFNFVMLTMLIPTQLGIVAFYMEMKAFGWTNHLISLIVPHCANAFTLFFVMQYAQQAIPSEVMESARIDGCSEWQVFRKICLPFLRPYLITIALLVFLWTWNNFMEAFIMISDEKLYTVPIAIKTLSTRYQKDIGAQILGLTIGTIPALAFFAIFNKNLISGLASSAVKG